MNFENTRRQGLDGVTGADLYYLGRPGSAERLGAGKRSPLSTVVAMDISEQLSSSAVPARFNDVAAEQWHIKGGLLLKQAANAPN